MEEDVQELIGGNFPIVATYRKDEPLGNGEAVWIGEVEQIAETGRIEEENSMFKGYEYDFLQSVF